MSIQSFPIGPLSTNCHLIHGGKDAIVVDPGGTLNEGLFSVLDYIKQNNLTVRAILLTHFHFDHLYGVQTLHEKTKAPIYGGYVAPENVDAYFNGGSRWGLPPVPSFTWDVLKEGTTSFGAISIQTFATPGHSIESLSFYTKEEEAVCTGDVLFYHSIGRTDLPGGDMPTLLTSIREKLFTLPDATRVFSGHGKDGTIGDEKIHNPFTQ